MKHFFILIIILYSISNASSQETFNLRLNYDAPAAILTSVLPTDSCYYLTGIIADSLPPFRAGNIFLKLDLSGNTLIRNKITSSIRNYESWENTLTAIDNNQFIVSGWSSFPDTTTVFYMKYDSLGNLIELKQYFHPDSTQASILNRDFKPTPEGGFIFLTSVKLEIGVDFYAIKINSIGDIEWQQQYGDNKWDAPFSILVDSVNNQIVLGGRKTNQSFTNSNYQYQTHLFALDSLGNELWTYLSPIAEGLRDGARDMILLDDGSLIVASGIGYEQERPSVNVIWFEKSVFKLNANQEKEWEVVFPEDTLTGSAKTTNLINLSDDSGVIVAGTDGDFNDGTFQLKGWLAKVSYDGESLWTRKYLHVDLENKVSFHEFFDVKETADGGLILCGESQDYTGGAEIPQQAWLLKLDEYGCLIPGCHLIDDVTETETVSYELKLYPNPTSDYLNIFMRHHRGSQDFTFRIRNAVGQQVAEFKQIIQEETLMIDLAGYASGVYYLEVWQKGRILETEKFVVTKRR